MPSTVSSNRKRLGVWLSSSRYLVHGRHVRPATRTRETRSKRGACTERGASEKNAIKKPFLIECEKGHVIFVVFHEGATNSHELVLVKRCGQKRGAIALAHEGEKIRTRRDSARESKQGESVNTFNARAAVLQCMAR